MQTAEIKKLVEIRNDIRDLLPSFDEKVLNERLAILANLKKYFISQDIQEASKEIWCLEKIIAIQKMYVFAFNQLKLEKYYEAWCCFENIEIALSQLFRHLDEKDDFFPLVSFIKQHSFRYQSLFPYKTFISPEFTVKSRTCSVCNKNSSIRHPCEHKNGEIYDGEMCYQIWSGIEYVLLALVNSPVQKFCVTFLTDSETEEKIDQYNYSILEYLMSCLQSPFHSWDVHWTKIRHPHSNYSHLDTDDDCPCESGESYRNCCLQKSGVLRPHCQFNLSVPPPESIAAVRYPKSTSKKKVEVSGPTKFHTSIAKISEYLVQTAKGDFVKIQL
ncbi:MAG: hypothetical protein AAF821_15725 [Cyanobacteria bacterium P01_D01_bin.156]